MSYHVSLNDHHGQQNMHRSKDFNEIVSAESYVANFVVENCPDFLGFLLDHLKERATELVYVSSGRELRIRISWNGSLSTKRDTFCPGDTVAYDNSTKAVVLNYKKDNPEKIDLLNEFGQIRKEGDVRKVSKISPEDFDSQEVLSKMLEYVRMYQDQEACIKKMQKLSEELETM